MRAPTLCTGTVREYIGTEALTCRVTEAVCDNSAEDPAGEMFVSFPVEEDTKVFAVMEPIRIGML